MQAQLIQDPKTWQDLTDQTHAPLSQRWIYGAAAQAIGRDVERVAVFNGSSLLGTAQVITRSFARAKIGLITRGPSLICSHEGPSTHDISAVSILKMIKKALPRHTLSIMTPNHQYRQLQLAKAPTLCTLDLSPSLDTLRVQMHQKWRNALKKSESSCSKAVQIPATANALMPLLRLEKHRQSQRMYKALPPEFTLALQKVSPRSLYLWKAEDAFMLFIRHGNSATYHMGCTGDQGRAANAHNLILWTAMKKLKSLGVETLDLGTIDLKNAPDLARFKTRCGAQIRQIGAAQKL